ncbi:MULTISPECIES: 3-oxoacyl-ACP synthase [unclassified Leeuwenhoekiella]|uniref:3-oxoacyl-ACP synthase n=1 Tax=unclassified Leeuwenhoekiella TaxID=2615029 RepID=UPI000C3CD82F|nr:MULTISPECIES: 3-oxoacyl-ACP synthase [unclassified Leeuwenhoekiella]MAW94435.1 3-oxoacyl-ACP synthase [Leeuwenhoekiella sp.]MBA81112.1 3-oxoacyl-ACP synthase [Leeuwenhoekiella sp.]|tara:strand:- start:8775 stop:9221 length:447 start_codon:yes stop_codon:yes gene_type:complete
MQKKQVIQELYNRLNARLTQLKETRDGLIESRESEGGKSSAGDKYETGVEMIQQEMERNQTQIDQVERQKEALNRVSLTPNTLISEGSLVLTDKASYFIGIPFGELKMETGQVYCISSASPIGELLTGKQENDQVQFRDQKITIKSIF